MGEVKREKLKAADLLADRVEKLDALERHRMKAEIDALKAEKRELLHRLDAAHTALVAADELRSNARPPKPIKFKVSSHQRQAHPVLMCSDWHVGEAVDPGKVSGVNTYNPEVAKVRADRLGEAACWLIDHHRKSFEIREVTVWLGGDLLTGFLHSDQQESNHLAPNREALFVQDRASELIDRLLGMPKIERVEVVCNDGNHGRLTIKQRISTRSENSLEWLLYQQLRRTYARESRVSFDIAEGEFVYHQIYDWTYRFTHGDATKFQGGVGGMTIPINKAIARWQTYKHADVTCMGHYHQYLDTPGLVVNGSLIGAAPYGMRVGSNEPPVQAFFLVDSKRGKCMSTPIWLDAKGEK